MMGVEFAGIKFRHPILLAPGPPTRNEEYVIPAEEAGAGGVVFKTAVADSMPLTRRWARPRFRLLDWERRAKTPASYTLYSIEQAYPGSQADYVVELNRITRRVRIPVLGSILAGPPEEWAEMARQVEGAGVKGIELDLACPHIPLTGDLSSLRRTVEAVVRAVAIPVIAKLKAVDPLLPAVRAAEEAGARGVTLCNRMSGLDIDIETRRPIMHGSYAGFGGPWSKYYVFRLLTEVGPSIGIPISATSGVTSADDVIKYILLGATTVQVCTAVILDGHEKLRELVSGTSRYFEQHRLTPAELRGQTLKSIIPLTDIEREPPVRAHHDEAKCRHCRRCVPVCYFNAIELVEKKVRFFPDRCDGCGLCAQVCPHGAVKMVRQENSKNQRT